MLHPDALERLSQYAAGELEPEARAALQRELEASAELREALAGLQQLDALVGRVRAAGLVTEGDRAAVRAWRAPAKRPAPVRWRLAAVALLVAGFFAGAWWQRTQSGAHDTSREALPPVVQTSRDQVLSAPFGRVLLGTGARVELDDAHTARLEQGSAVFLGSLQLKVAGETIVIDGATLVSTEPELALAHVMPVVTSTGESDMQESLKRSHFSSSAALVVLVLQGTATVASAGTPLARGQAWSPPSQVAKSAPLSPAPSPESPSEPFSFTDLNDAVRQQTPALIKCAEAGLADLNEPKTFVAMLMLQRREGRTVLAEAMTAEGSTLSPLTSNCVLSALHAVRYPDMKGQDELSVKYTLHFEARGKTGVTIGFDDEEPTTHASLVAMPDRHDVLDVQVGASPVTGPSDAKVTVVLFSELECPFCQKAAPTFAALRREYAGRSVRFVYKHRPLPHDLFAQRAAVALEAAHEQGKFWEYLDAVSTVHASTDEALLNAAMGLRLDVKRFRDALTGPTTKAAVDADGEQAQRLGVKGVPSTFVNGRELVGARPIDEVRALIDDALKR